MQQQNMAADKKTGAINLKSDAKESRKGSNSSKLVFGMRPRTEW